MRIERINDNQIRCTLNKRDLAERHLKISELAYGSDKAKKLFRDMMEQAHMDYGFEADDIPLMIEAIPTSRDSIVLVITKVDNPEELEERFGASLATKITRMKKMTTIFTIPTRKTMTMRTTILLSMTRKMMKNLTMTCFILLSSSMKSWKMSPPKRTKMMIIPTLFLCTKY